MGSPSDYQFANDTSETFCNECGTKLKSSDIIAKGKCEKCIKKVILEDFDIVKDMLDFYLSEEGFDKEKADFVQECAKNNSPEAIFTKCFDDVCKMYDYDYELVSTYEAEQYYTWGNEFVETE